MSKYINKRQLAFLIFILTAFLLIRWMRSDEASIQQKVIQSSTEASFREMPAAYTEQAQCLKDCLELSDSSVALVLKYGVITEKGNPIQIKGNSLAGEEITLSVTKQNSKNLIKNIQHDKANSCLCH